MAEGYTISLERGDANLAELYPIYRQHYGEMRDRLAKDGFAVGDFNMNLNVYLKAWSEGWLLNFVARKDGAAVGYSNIYLTNDMHNGELIAQEDAIYILPSHRNGIGRKLARFVLDELKTRGAKRLDITAVTDTRAINLWRRMGFREVATQMQYVFEGH